MRKEPIPTHDLYDKLGEVISFDFQLMEEKQHYDSTLPHRHSYYEIFLFLKGGGTHEIDFISHPIEPNALNFISPGQVHLVQRAPKSHGYVILFSRDFFHLGLQNKDILYDMPFFNNNTAKPVVNIPNSELNLFKDIFNKIQNEYLTKSISPDKDEIIRSYLNALLIYSRRLFQLAKTDTPIPGTGGSPHEMFSISRGELIRKFRILIEKKFMHEHRVSEYAGILSVSANHLNDTVQKMLGKSASELIHERIILEAKRLLYHSEQNINEIAFELNFDDPSYFTRFFKNQVGTAPGSFRDQIRKKYQI